MRPASRAPWAPSAAASAWSWARSRSTPRSASSPPRTAVQRRRRPRRLPAQHRRRRAGQVDRRRRPQGLPLLQRHPGNKVTLTANGQPVELSERFASAPPADAAGVAAGWPHMDARAESKGLKRQAIDRAPVFAPLSAPGRTFADEPRDRVEVLAADAPLWTRSPTNSMGPIPRLSDFAPRGTTIRRKRDRPAGVGTQRSLSRPPGKNPRASRRFRPEVVVDGRPQTSRPLPLPLDAVVDGRPGPSARRSEPAVQPDRQHIDQDLLRAGGCGTSNVLIARWLSEARDHRRVHPRHLARSPGPGSRLGQQPDPLGPLDRLGAVAGPQLAVQRRWCAP